MIQNSAQMFQTALYDFKIPCFILNSHLSKKTHIDLTIKALSCTINRLPQELRTDLLPSKQH